MTIYYLCKDLIAGTAGAEACFTFAVESGLAAMAACFFIVFISRNP
jgi:hypothetical protein